MLAPMLKTRYGSGDGTQFVYQSARGVNYTIPRGFPVGSASGVADPDADTSVKKYAPQSANFDDSATEFLPFKGTTGFRLGASGTGNFEINARILWDDDTVPQIFLAKSNLAAPANIFQILPSPQLGTPLIRFIVTAAGETTWVVDFDITGYAKDVWHNFRVTREDVTIKMYMDGSELSTTTFLNAAIIPSSGYAIPEFTIPLTIGVRQYNGGAAQFYWSGNVQDFRISYVIDGPFDANRPFG